MSKSESYWVQSPTLPPLKWRTVSLSLPPNSYLNCNANEPRYKPPTLPKKSDVVRQNWKALTGSHFSQIY